MIPAWVWFAEATETQRRASHHDSVEYLNWVRSGMSTKIYELPFSPRLCQGPTTEYSELPAFSASGESTTMILRCRDLLDRCVIAWKSLDVPFYAYRHKDVETTRGTWAWVQICITHIDIWINDVDYHALEETAFSAANDRCFSLSQLIGCYTAWNSGRQLGHEWNYVSKACIYLHYYYFFPASSLGVRALISWLVG